MKFKYIRTRAGFILFSQTIKHSDVAKGLDDIQSAGFCTITSLLGEEQEEFYATCYGESISLNKTHGDGDSESLTRQINTNY